MYALAALLGKNSLEALEIAEPMLKGEVNDDGGELGYVAHRLMGIDDVRAIPSMVRLLSAPSDLVREGAAYSLRATGSVATIPALSKALYDKSRRVRYHAVDGLCHARRRRRSQ